MALAPVTLGHRLGAGIASFLAQAFGVSLAFCAAMAGFALFYIGRHLQLGTPGTAAVMEQVTLALGGIPPTGLWWMAAALLAWLMAEFAARRSRFSATSIVLAVLFAVFSAHAINTWLNFAGFEAQAPALTASGTVLAFVAHYYRFRLPFTVLPVAAAGWLFAVGAVTIAAQYITGSMEAPPKSLISPVTLAYGIAMFLWAMRRDADPAKRDSAFWLHVLAAFLIAAPTLGPLADHAVSAPSDPLAAMMLTLLLLFFLTLSLLADRAALIVVSIGLVLAAFAIDFVRSPAAGVGVLIAGASLLEAILVALIFVWMPLRRRFLALIPVPWADRLSLPISGT